MEAFIWWNIWLTESTWRRNCTVYTWKKVHKIVDHLNVFNTLICQLTSMDVKYNDEDKEIMLLCSLFEYWDHLVTSMWFSTIDTIEYDIVLGALLSEEVRRKSSLETSTIQTMVAIGRSTERGKDLSGTSWDKSKGRKGKGKGRCWYCNKLGHLKKDCWKMKESKDDSKMEANLVE